MEREEEKREVDEEEDDDYGEVGGEERRAEEEKEEERGKNEEQSECKDVEGESKSGGAEVATRERSRCDGGDGGAEWEGRGRGEMQAVGGAGRCDIRAGVVTRPIITRRSPGT